MYENKYLHGTKAKQNKRQPDAVLKHAQQESHFLIYLCIADPCTCSLCERLIIQLSSATTEIA